MRMAKEDKVILLGGGCDPVVMGHIKLIEDAAQYGKVIWALNSDAWLKKKKGYVFMQWEERHMVLKSIRGIHDVIKVDDEDGSINKAVELIKPDFFGHGGVEYDIPEKKLCDELGVKMVWGLGGDIKFNSNDIVDCMINSLIDKIEPHFKK
jgi:glycerol-3-phosphate cytidylyltransferase-like family protein